MIELMNRYIKNAVEKQYQIDIDTATKKEIDNIKEINVGIFSKCL